MTFASQEYGKIQKVSSNKFTMDDRKQATSDTTGFTQVISTETFQTTESTSDISMSHLMKVLKTTMESDHDQIKTGELETTLLTSYLIIALLWTTLANMRIFYLVLSRDTYHVPYYYIIASYCLADTIQVGSSTPLMISGILLAQDYVSIPSWICTVSGALTAAMIFVSFHTLGFMAIERYYFFVRPLKYPNRFTSCFTFAVLTLIWIVAIIFAIVIEVMGTKQFYITIFHCQTPSAKLFSYIQVTLYLIPTLSCTLFSLLKLWILQTSHQARVQDMASTNTAFHRSAKKFHKSKGTAIKIIMLTSGSFWVTFLPIGIFRLVVFSQGITWSYLDSFQNPALSYTFRYLNVSLYTLSSVMNPMIYMYTHKTLRHQFIETKCCGKMKSTELSTVESIVTHDPIS